MKEVIEKYFEEKGVLLSSWIHTFERYGIADCYDLIRMNISFNRHEKALLTTYMVLIKSGQK